MRYFEQEVKGIYRLRVPFEKIYTSVFLIENDKGTVLVDCASTAEDVDNCIIPALAKMYKNISDVKALVLTHKHCDHAGGLERILSLASNIEVITEVQVIYDGILVYSMAGHTEDSIGVLDEQTNTLISGDGLQGAGVDKYRCYIQNPKAYIQTLERIRYDKRIENILFSHAYEPWNKDYMYGRNSVTQCLYDCKKHMKLS